MAKPGQEILLEKYYGRVAEALLSNKNADESSRRELFFFMICTFKAIGDFAAANDLDNAYKNTFGISCSKECCKKTGLSMAI